MRAVQSASQTYDRLTMLSIDFLLLTMHRRCFAFYIIANGKPEDVNDSILLF